MVPRERVGRGTPIVPSYALALWYRRQVNDLSLAMIEDYKQNIEAFLQTQQARKFYAMDSVASSFTNLLRRLQKKWSNIFTKMAAKIAADFVKKVDEGATMATFASLKTAGLQHPVAKYTENVKNTLQGAEEYNKTLITDIGADMHDKIFGAVMLSLTSPNPEEQGVSGIENKLKELGTFSKKRMRLIATDQNSKLYSALSDERMIQNGVEEFEWAHSGGGKEPRTSHLHMDGMRFKINDKRLWEVGGVLKLKKGDVGPPGWAIHCRCRKIPII